MWGYMIWGILLVFIIAMLVKMRSMYSTYVCPECKREFTLTPVREFLFPQIMYRKIARCPSCHKIVRAVIIRSQGNVENTKTMDKGTKDRTENKAKRR